MSFIALAVNPGIGIRLTSKTVLFGFQTETQLNPVYFQSDTVRFPSRNPTKPGLFLKRYRSVPKPKPHQTRFFSKQTPFGSLTETPPNPVCFQSGTVRFPKPKPNQTRFISKAILFGSQTKNQPNRAFFQTTPDGS